MAGIQIVGSTNNTTAAEVEVNTKALRAVIRPNDYGSLGIYALGATSGTMAAGLAANSPVYAFRWGSASNFAVLRKVLMTAGNAGTGFAAGAFTFALFFARSYTVSDTGGTAITPTGSLAKLRSSMGTTLLTDARISSTATLTAGTRTLDTTPLGALTQGVTTAAGVNMTPNAPPLFIAQAGDYPVVFAQNEGFVIQASVPATGTWVFSVATIWEELAAY